MAESQDSLQDQLRMLNAAYAARLPAIISQVESAWSALRAEWSEETRAELHHLVHGITGSGATFGFAALSDAARRLESEIAESAAGSARPSDDCLATLNTLVGELLDAVRAGD